MFTPCLVAASQQSNLPLEKLYGTGIIEKPEDKPDRALEDDNSYYNPAGDYGNAYDWNDYSNFYHNTDLVVIGVNPNNPTNNHTPPHQQQQDGGEWFKNIKWIIKITVKTHWNQQQ